MRLGIIGTGRIARRFVPECRYVSEIEITAVYNPHEGSAEGFVNSLWTGEGGGKPLSLSTEEELWKETDAIYIASPHETHFHYIMTALRQDKHVICEKPLALSDKQAAEAFEYADDHGLVLMEGIKTAYCPGYRRLLEIVKGGIAGDIKYIESCFTKLEDPLSRELTDTDFGGSFLELGSYVMLPIIDIFGNGYEDLEFHSINNDRGLDIFTRISTRYPNALATAVCGLGVKAEGRLLIGGTKGYILVPAPWWKTTTIEVHFEDPSKLEVYEEPFEGDGLRYELKRFYELTKGTLLPDKKEYEHVSIEMAGLMQTVLKQRNPDEVRGDRE